MKEIYVLTFIFKECDMNGSKTTGNNFSFNFLNIFKPSFFSMLKNYKTM